MCFRFHHLVRKSNKATSDSYFLYFLKVTLSEKHTHKKKKKESFGPNMAQLLQDHFCVSSACLQATWPRTRLCFQSPRRPSCGRPCWRRPPGTRRGRTGCRLQDRQEVSTEGSRHVRPRAGPTLTSCFTEHVVASEEVSSCQTTADVKQEETQLPTL